MYEQLVALLGIGGGVALAFIAPEETKPGRKYISLAAHIFFWILVAGLVWYAIKISAVMAILITVAAIVLFSLSLAHSWKWWFLVQYAFLFIATIFFTEGTFLLSALFFLYGLPIGTLAKMHYE